MKKQHFLFAFLIVAVLLNGCNKGLPSVETSDVTQITANSAECGGEVTDNGEAVFVRGICWSEHGKPTVKDLHTTDNGGVGIFTNKMENLSPNTTYHVRAYAMNSSGTGYGSVMSFTTKEASSDGRPCPGTPIVTDYEGNTYNTVQIGNQCWMKENLRTTHFSNGTEIPKGGGNSFSDTSPYYYDYSNPDIPLEARGYLYNRPAAMHGTSASSAVPSGVQGICPAGWHIPSDAEWTQLKDYVGSQSEYMCDGNSYRIAKALASTEYWYSGGNFDECSPGNQSQTINNATGFSAVPAGDWDAYYMFEHLGSYSFFWTSSISNNGRGHNIYISCSISPFSLGDFHMGDDPDHSDGQSVRCLKN